MIILELLIMIVQLVGSVLLVVVMIRALRFMDQIEHDSACGITQRRVIAERLADIQRRSR